MAIKIRRGLEADRTSVIFEEGEVLYTTDTKSFFIGDGVTAGGNQIGGTTAASLLKTEVHNATGTTLTAGQVVYLSGNTGNKPNAVLAKADAEATSSKTIGLIILNIANNANGDIATDGLLSDIDTSAFAPGDLLWLSDSVAGGVTTIVPDTPNHAVFIGYIVAAHPTQGKILIHIQNGYELNELHDVKITSVANGESLTYSSSLGYWKNTLIDKTSIGLGNVTNVDTTNADNITSGTLSDSRLSANVTTQGNTFNAANKLVQLDATAKLPAVDGSQLTNLPSFTPPNGLLKIASAISTTLQTVTDYLGNLSVLQLNSRRVGLLSDSSVTTQTSAVIEAQTTNASLVLKPNGTGAIIANVPDGTATGGNARGDYSVDLQMLRNNATEISFGRYSGILSGRANRIANTGATFGVGDYCVIAGGGSNTINVTTTGNYNTVSGGNGNSIPNNTSYATIGGGQNNSGTSSGYSHWTVSGGSSNNASSNYATISGGQSNTASTNTHATVVGGQSNTSSGNHSISGGQTNTSSAARSVALGEQNTASNSATVAIGRLNVANATYSVAIGNRNQATAITSMATGSLGNAYLFNQNSFGNGIANLGDCQYSTLLPYRDATLTTAATTTLFLDGSSLLIIPNTSTKIWNVQIDTIAVVTAITGTATGVSVGDCYRETKQLLFKRIGGTSSIVGTVDTTSIKSDTSMSTAVLTVTAGASQQMALTFTAPTFAGGGSVTCRVVSKVSLVEVAY